MPTTGAFGNRPFGTGPFGPKSTGGSITTMTADHGSFTLTGQAATFKVTQASAVGSFALNGQAATFKVTQASSFGSFTYTGQAATFKVTQATAVGSFTYSGSVTFDLTFVGGTGQFTLSGRPIDLVSGEVVYDRGGRFTGGTFSRGRWHEFVGEEIRKQKKRELAALKAKEEKRRRRDEKRAARREAIFAEREAQNALLQEQLRRNALAHIANIDLVNRTLQEAVAQGAYAAQEARRVKMEQQRLQQEEEDDLMLLMSM